MQNGWFLRLLSAEGHLHQGHREEAIAAAHASVAALPISQDRFGAYTAARAAFVLVWSGAIDEAMVLLETLFEFRALTGIAPVLFNSKLAVALAGNARFQSLKARVESELLAVSPG